MKRYASIVSLISLLALNFCGKSGEKPASQLPGHEKNEPMATVKKAAAAPLLIHAVAFSPAAPTVLDDVVAMPELVAAEAADISFNYQWFVNGQEIVDVREDRLGMARLKKGMWIYCRVQAVSGSNQSAWFKSDIVRVLNTLPTLELPPLKKFSVPGEFHYQPMASDPDADELTFEVLAPLDQGITIDPRTGALSWPLKVETVKSLGESIEIKIAVSDGEGEKVTGTITLNLTSTRQTK
jgi:hypothetical protein